MDLTAIQSAFPFILMFIVFYFFMIRPQSRRQKKEAEYKKNLKSGDKIITKSGLHGKVAEINEANDTVVIETMSGKLKLERSAISMEMSQKLNTTTIATESK